VIRYTVRGPGCTPAANPKVIAGRR